MKKNLRFYLLVIFAMMSSAIIFAQADVTITVIDESLSYDTIQFKGTPTDWANVPMYDDGTNGDLVAGDHIWTVVLLQVPEGDHEWGAVDGSDAWLIVGPNRTFNITDGVVTGQTSYTIPMPSTITVDVTFTITDLTMSYEGLQFKGAMTGWGLVPMWDDGTHGDGTAGDHIWTVMIDSIPADAEYEWGAVDVNDQWLISGPNRLVSVDAEGNVTGDVSYTIPAWGEVSVTFTVDMNCQINAGFFNLDSCLDLYMDGYPPVLMEFIGEGVFQVTVTRFNVGETLNYKYRIGCAFGPTELQEYPGENNNRVYTVVDGDNIIPQVWYQDDQIAEPCAWNSIFENDVDVEAYIYPNPANDYINVSIDNYQAVKQITISNILGQNVYTLENLTNGKIIIPVSNLDNGLYFLSLKGYQGGTYTEKIVIR
jgi:hypothetical protein